MKDRALVEIFAKSFSSNGGDFFPCSGYDDSARAIAGYITAATGAGASASARIFISGSLPAALKDLIEAALKKSGAEFVLDGALGGATDVCVTAFDSMMAADGAVAVSAATAPPEESLLPPVSVLFADSPETFGNIAGFLGRAGGHERQITLIAGPSKTADIEKQLINGMHGPGKVAVVAIFK